MVLQKIMQRLQAWMRWLERSTRTSSSASNPLVSTDRHKSGTCDSPEDREAVVLDPQGDPPTETPISQSGEQKPDNDQSNIIGNVTGNRRHDGSPIQPEPSNLDNDGPKETPSTSPEIAPRNPESPSTQATKDTWNASHGNDEVDDLSQTNSTGSLPELSETAKLPRDNTPAEISNSPESNEDGKTREPIAPQEIGGRRKPQSPTPRPKQRRPITSAPELVCRKVPALGLWEIALSVSDESRIAKVKHDGKLLDIGDGECCLPSFVGRLSFVFEDDKQNDLPLFDNKPMIFKLLTSWSGDGRRVSGITNGYFIVIAPNDWKRTGHVPVEPENCRDANFSAHYFFRDDGEDVGGFQEYKIPLSKSGLELTGERLFDDSDCGDLFVGDVPNLEIRQGIAWARIGEERRSGWKGENFNQSEQSLSEILNNYQGTFFVRVYDFQINLIDSSNFRYMRDLKQISVNGEPYTKNTILLPELNGHPPTEVHFVGIGGATIRPVLSSRLEYIKVQEDSLIVEPNPNVSNIPCILESDSGHVDIVLNLPRVWWRMEQDSKAPSVWQDTPLAMTRQDFREYAYANATICLRLPRRIRSVHVGFNDTVNRSYNRKPKEGNIAICLVDFVDYTQIDQQQYEDASFNVECSGKMLQLIRIIADPVPEIISFMSEPTILVAGDEAIIRWTTRNAEVARIVIDSGIGVVESNGSYRVAPSETTTYTLRLTAPNMDDITRTLTVAVSQSSQLYEKPVALVRSTDGRWRHGKGFSYGELQAAGLTDNTTLRTISIDKRRRSMHPVNVENVRRLISV